jgi:REP element-mobilizing transposase RayT
LGKIVGAFKSLCVTAWLREIKTDTINARGKFWQTNYYEHVVRNEDEMTRIRQYIIDNPARWELDKENPMSREQQQQLEKWMI